MSDQVPPKCPHCGADLEERHGELWCETSKRLFKAADVEANNTWRNFDVNARVILFKELGEERARERYYLRDEQIEETRRLVTESESVRETRRVLVMPEKDSLLALARAITDDAALCELIDNAIDAGKVKRPGQAVSVVIDFNTALRSLTVRDDAGGMDEDDMRRCFTLGSQKLDRTAGLIGRYGIGAKEAIYHFGRSVIVRSRTLGSRSGIRTIITEGWLGSPDWLIDIERGLDDIPEGTTSIEIGNLGLADFNSADRIRHFLAHTYERLIEEGSLVILMQDQLVAKEVVYEPLYPPELFPRTYEMLSGNVRIILRVMLIHRPADASGMVFYAQGRRFAHLGWSHLRTKLLLEKVQRSTLRDHIRVEVDFEGPIEEIPINANKDDVRENQLMATIRPVVSKLVDPYFRAIPPLSQDGAMRLVNTITKDHKSACLEDWCRNLGRLTDRKPIPTSYIADVELFKVFLRDRLVPVVSRVEPPHAPVPAPAPSGTKEEILELQLEGTTRKIAAIKPTTTGRFVGEISFLSSSEDGQTQFQEWLAAGRDLGVEIVEGKDVGSRIQ